MRRKSFTRAWRFLNYKPVAKWLALSAAVATGVLYVALLVILGLFADLMVNRGKIPAFHDLSSEKQTEFLETTWIANSPAKRQEMLEKLGVEGKKAEELAQAPDKNKELAWRSYVFELLSEQVGPEAASVVGVTRESGDRDLIDHGLLSLVVRSRDRIIGPVIGWMARLLPWTWQRDHTGQNYFRYMRWLLVMAFGLALLRALAMYGMTYMAAQAVVEASNRLRRAVYHHTFRLGTLAFRALGPSEAVGIFTRQLESVHDGLFTRLTVFVREPVKFGLLLALALVIHFWLALAFLLFALLVWLVGGQVAAYLRRQERSATRQSAEQLALLQECLMLMRLVKCYLMEVFNQSRVERLLSSHAKAQMGHYRGRAIYRPLLIFLGTLAALVLMYVAGLIVLGGHLGIASAITLATALVSLYWPLVNWLDNRRYLRRGREAADVLFGFLDRPGEVGQVVGAEFLAPMVKKLEFINVSLKEPGTGRVLLNKVNLTIQAGQRVALVGADDMEKHALVYLIPRFLDPNAGEIRIDDHNLRWVTFDSLRAQIAIVLQHNLVFNDTIANNIGCGDPSFDLPKIIEAAKVAHAHQFIQKLSQGYETPIGEMGHYLNVGQQYRIALARALLRDPALLIVEETVIPLDDETKALVDDTFSRILAGRTVLFLPHRVSTIRACDHVFLLHRGQVEAAGDHRQLLSENQLYRHLQYIEFNEFVDQVS